MIPPIFTTLSANAGVTAIIGAGDNCRCYPFGFAKQGTTIPYVTWFKVSGQPLNKLFKGSFTDKIRAQVDCWAGDGASALALARAVRSSLETSGCMIGLNFTERDAETRLYRYSMDFEFIVNRGAVAVPNAYTLLADSIAYALTCSDAGLYFGRRLVADSASYALTLNNVTLTYYQPFDPASLFTGGYLGYAYDPSDYSKVWQNSTRTTPVTAVTDPIGCVDDISGNGANRTQATSTQRPLAAASGYYDFDGVDDNMVSTVVTTGGGTWTHIARMQTDSDTTFVAVYGTNVNNYFGTAQSGSGSATTGVNVTLVTLEVGGTAVTNTRGSLYTALNTGNKTMFTEVSWSGDAGWGSNVKVGAYAGFTYSGKFGREILINRVLTAGEKASAIAWVEAF